MKYKPVIILDGADASHPARGAWIEILEDGTYDRETFKSHPARGAWIEMSLQSILFVSLLSHPARGAWIEILGVVILCLMRSRSHPARGAWIEIVWAYCLHDSDISRTPQGVRGLKFRFSVLTIPAPSRTPRGVRGLK